MEASWRTELQSACSYLFELHRYAKHAACSKAFRDTIYRLKDDLIEMLYGEGYCTDCYEHNAVGRPVEGVDGLLDGFQPNNLKFVCFRFAVDGKTYCWHRPWPVSFYYQVTCDESAFTMAAEEKPVGLDAAELQEGQKAIEQVIRAYHDSPECMAYRQREALRRAAAIRAERASVARVNHSCPKQLCCERPYPLVLS